MSIGESGRFKRAKNNKAAPLVSWSASRPTVSIPEANKKRRAIMTEELRQKIIVWTGKNVVGYIIRSCENYRNDMVQDAIKRYGPCDQTDEANDLRDQITELVRKRLNCEC
jgi:hypothetical protein